MCAASAPWSARGSAASVTRESSKRTSPKCAQRRFSCLVGRASTSRVGRTTDQCDPLGIGAHRHRRWLRHIRRAGGEQPCPRPYRRRSAGGCTQPTGYHHRLVVRQEVSSGTRGGASGLGRHPRRAGRRTPRDQVAHHPAAGPAALTDGLDALHAIIVRWISASHGQRR
jgi:hypothetical protein